MRTDMMRILLILMALSLTVDGASAEDRSFTEEQRRVWNRQYDRQMIRGTNITVTDEAVRFVTVPEDMDLGWMGDVDVAETPPVIEFVPVSGMTPEYFPRDEIGYWSNFGDITEGPNGRFYFAVGDHRGRHGNAYIYEYDPAERSIGQVVDCGRLCGWDKRGVGDGKIHGEMGIMPDGQLWGLTYWDPMSWSTEEDERTWQGSHLVRYDTFSREAEDMGIPLAKAGWPYFTLDRERGNLCAVGFKGEILNYSVKKREVTFAGFPPDDIRWWERCMMLDPATGVFWSCTKDAPHRFVSFDPATNEFRLHDATLPEDLGRNAGRTSHIRAHAERRSSEGFIWVASENGTLYKFWPDEVRTEVVTHLWSDYTYSPRMSLSPDGKYLYYVANTKRTDYRYRPIVQYNTQTNRRKVLAFVTDYYWESYGYQLGSVHGSALSHSGDAFVIVFNGSFLPRDIEWQDTPALMVVHIPEEERE